MEGRVMEGHGGELLAATLGGYGVGEIFALAGGHTFPLDVVFAHGQANVPEGVMPRGAEPDSDEVAKAAALIAGAERPVLVAGSDVWWDGAWDALRRCVEELRVPTFVNGMGRGCLPADHEP